MQTIFHHLSQIVRQIRTNACRNGRTQYSRCTQYSKYILYYSDADTADELKRTWLEMPYYEKVWELAKKEARPRGMESLFYR